MIVPQRLDDAGPKDVLRFFHREDAPAGSPFDAVCEAHWSDPESMWVHGLLVRNGRLTRKWLLQLLEIAENGGARWIKYKRGDGIPLPGGIVQSNGDIWVPVHVMRARVPFDTNFASL